VEAALKTARLATGRPGILAFEGGYHGLGYGALNATHRDHFRVPFENQLKRFGYFLPFPVDSYPCGKGAVTARQLIAAAQRVIQKHRVGAILVEPIQCRGGVNVPPTWFLPTLRKLCDRHGLLLILDEIYTGFGRAGAWFACEHFGVVPDMLCLGKALTGGFPLSACVGRADLMDAAWPEATGEAIHTSTFLGHPVGCSMALAQIAEIRARRLMSRSARLGRLLLRELHRLAEDITAGRLVRHSPAQTHQRNYVSTARGVGLLAGLELCRAGGAPASEEVVGLMKRMLNRGFILLPEGEHGHVISFTPPLIISEAEIRRTLAELRRSLIPILTAGPGRRMVAGNRHRRRRAQPKRRR
jgi:4-aminobutyrate aminotransferase-like enzyme